MTRALPALIGGLLIIGAADVQAQSLRGSSLSMERQNQIAKSNDFSFLQTRSEVSKFVDRGLLVRLGGNSQYELAGVSYPYARPQIKTFVERLASQYRDACGDKLVVTSLTRPISRQPRNASDLSVHPAGMAVDLRIAKKASCRSWLENTLLYLEKQGALDATRERNPAHYHVAVFPDKYLRYVASVDNSAASTRTPASSSSHAKGGGAAADSYDRYKVGSGDSLWSIAKRYKTSVAELKQLNNIKGSRIVAGQQLIVPPAGG